ncbi:hypothetical protein N6H14_18205 [Paenibacillus sp. CC-CFT747]|nr:hypothetical protein N6H14_18205 [Paenibacillus sp. CC-CFT747]
MTERTIACLHAHHSNIAYFDSLPKESGLSFVHFTEPGLSRRLAGDAGFTEAQASARLAEMVRWIASCRLEAVLVTCTQYCALLPEVLQAAVPVYRLDRLFFAGLCSIEGPQRIVFTNPAGVEPGMAELNRYAESADLTLEAEPLLIPDSFELVMSGRQEEYRRLVTSFLERNASSSDRPLSVFQLSMTEAAEQAERTTGRRIGHPMREVAAFLQGLPAGGR